jgi:uncharacterized protein (UPF0332 family)
MKERFLKFKIDGYVQSRDLYEDKDFVVLTSYYLDKSRHNLETANLLFKLSEDNESKKALTLREDYYAYDWVISASYYAMFHAATAVLGSLGLRARTHECLIEALEYLFVHKRKILEIEVIEKIIHLKSLEKRYIDRMWSIKSRRNIAHYKAEESISRSDAQKSLQDAYGFVERMEELIDEMKD